jgi:hypothetical protein
MCSAFLVLDLVGNIAFEGAGYDRMRVRLKFISPTYSVCRVLSAAGEFRQLPIARIMDDDGVAAHQVKPKSVQPPQNSPQTVNISI